jgi:hypothetical protein
MRTAVLSLLVFTLPLPAADAPAGTPLFNGKDLTGWVTKKENDSLDRKTEAYKGRFKVNDGEIVIDAKVKGDLTIQTAKEFGGDLRLAFEFFPGPKCNNDLFFRGTKFDLKAQDIKNLRENEWNRFEIVVKGDKAEFRNNGESIKTLPTKAARSALGIRAEAGPVRFRNLTVKEGS